MGDLASNRLVVAALPEARVGQTRFVLGPVLLRIASVVLLLAIWQLVGSQLNPILLSTPTAVGAAFVELLRTGDLVSATASTTSTFLLGFGLAVLIGIPLGVAMGRYAAVAHSLELYVVVFYAMPGIVLIPLFIIWFGLGITAKIAIVFFATVFSIVINVRAGVHAADKSLLEVGRAFGATERELLLRFILPASVPFIMAGLQIGIGRALVATIVADIIMSISGLGGLIAYYGNFFKTAYYFAPVIVVAALSIVASNIVAHLQARTEKWRI
jgi:NitT/TauT family transport system permease protein